MCILSNYCLPWFMLLLVLICAPSLPSANQFFSQSVQSQPQTQSQLQLSFSRLQPVLIFY